MENYTFLNILPSKIIIFIILPWQIEKMQEKDFKIYFLFSMAILPLFT